MLARKRLAREPLRHPVRDQNRRERSEIGGRDVADRMARFLIDHHLLRPLDRLDQPLGMLDRAELLALAGDDEIGHADFLRMAFPGDGLAELIELVLVGDARHVHEPLLEGGRRLLKDGVAAGLVAHRHGGKRADARLVGAENGAEESAEARTGTSDALGIDFAAAAQPVEERLAGRHPVFHREIHSDHGRFVLSRSVDRQNRHAAVEEAIAVERDLDFLEAVHARDGDHRGNAAAVVARWQMKPGRDRLVAKRHPHRLDVMIRQRSIFRVAFALLVVVGDVGFVVLIVRPLRRAPMDRGHEVIVARGHPAIGLLGGFRLGLAPACHRLERWADVRHLLHALADAGEIGVGLVAARTAEIERARLVPVDAVGADNVVEEPTLRLEAAHVRLAALVQNWLRWADHVHHIHPCRCMLRGSRRREDHSGLPPTALRIGVQRASSSWKTPSALSGPTSRTDSKPSLTSSLWNSPSASACWVTALMRARIGAGVPAGAKMPNVVCATIPASPASIEVGRSGAPLTRVCEFTDRMRTLPARWRSRICAVALAESIGICSPITSVTAWPMPL